MFMGLFKPNYNAEGPGVRKDEEQKPAFVRFFLALKNRFWQIVLLNIVYVFACLPVITIGPATAGMTYVMRNFSQSKHADFFSDFIEKAKEHFWKSLLVTVIDAAVAALAFYAFRFWSAPELQTSSVIRTIALVFVFLSSYIVICMNFYIFPMMVSFDLPLKNLIKNSIILSMYKILPTLAMLLFNAVITLLCVVFFPMSLPVVLFISFTFCSLFNNSMVYPLLVKYVATPKEEKEVDEEEQIFKD